MTERQKHQAAAQAGILKPGPRGAANIDDQHENFRKLRVTEIDFSAINPRKHRGERYESLKESILTGGFWGSLQVTKVNGRFVLLFGGNTRLQILKELYQEGHKEFEYVTTIFRPFAGDDLDQAILNLTENENRSEVVFADKAAAVMQMLALFNQKRKGAGRRASIDEFVNHIKSNGGGAAISKALVSYYKFAVDYRLTEWWDNARCVLLLQAVKTLAPAVRILENIDIPENYLTGEAREEKKSKLMRGAIIEAMRNGFEDAVSENPQISSVDVAAVMLENLNSLFFRAFSVHTMESRKNKLKQLLTGKIPGGDAVFSRREQNGKKAGDLPQNKRENLTQKVEFIAPKSLKAGGEEHAEWWLTAAFTGQFCPDYVPPKQNAEAVEWGRVVVGDEKKIAEAEKMLGGRPEWFGALTNLLRDTRSRQRLLQLLTAANGDKP